MRKIILPLLGAAVMTVSPAAPGGCATFSAGFETDQGLVSVGWAVPNRQPKPLPPLEGNAK